MTAKLTVTTTQGTFSRKTDRPYTFVAVTGDLTEPAWRKAVTEHIAYSVKLAADYRAKADRLDRGSVDPRDILADKYGLDGYAAKLRAWANSQDISAARAQAELAAGQPLRGSVLGGAATHKIVTWHGSRALAVKELDKRLAKGFSKIGIFPVNQQ
jgi:hypothetical protein